MILLVQDGGFFFGMVSYEVEVSVFRTVARL